MILVGPCMIVAPFVAALAIVAVPLWPFAIILVAALWLVIWPLERLVALTGLRFMDGWSAAMGRLVNYVARPWVYLDTRYPSAPRADDEPGPGP